MTNIYNNCINYYNTIVNLAMVLVVVSEVLETEPGETNENDGGTG